VPEGIIDLTQNLTQNLFELSNAQREDATQREAATLHLANCHDEFANHQREDATQREVAALQREQKIPEEIAKREHGFPTREIADWS